MIAAVTKSENLKSGFERVRTAAGMPGADGISIREFAESRNSNLGRLAWEIEEGVYFPLPLLRFLVAKKDGSPRPLAVPTVKDRVAQSAVLNIIEPIFEAEFEECSHGYRRGRSVKTAARHIRELRDKGCRFVVEVDIDSFFDNIDHDLLLKKIRTVIRDEKLIELIMAWVKAEVYDGQQVYTLKKGIAQGSVISPMLANLFLDEFDEAMESMGYHMVRYADDFVVMTETLDKARRGLELTDVVLKMLFLDIDEEDTRITDFENGFKYLGLVFMKDSLFEPFDRPKKEKRVIYMPPPFDLNKYLEKRKV